jgi:threonine synthase
VVRSLNAQGTLSRRGKEDARLRACRTAELEIARRDRLPDRRRHRLVGMWKAFAEMEEMGWIDGKRPRMVSVQAEGCAPIVRAFAEGKRFADEFPNATTVASGLRVPRAIGDFLILDAIRASGGTAVTVTDRDMIDATREIGSAEGVFCAPEGAACLPALKKLLRSGHVKRDDEVVLFNTGAGVKYLEVFAATRGSALSD